MKKLTAYKMTVEEAEERLQYLLDDSGLRLTHHLMDIDFTSFFCAESDSQFLDGSEIDERFAQILGVGAVEHYATDDGQFLALVTDL